MSKKALNNNGRPLGSGPLDIIEDEIFHLNGLFNIVGFILENQ